MPAVSDDVQQTQADKVEASQTPSLKSLAVFFAPLSPMNPVPRMWLFGYGPAVISYLLYFGQGAPPPFVLRYALLGAASGAALDERPAWMAALDCGERVVLLAVHLFLVLFHLGAATFFKSEAGAAMLAEARDLAFTDAPRGAAAYDAIQWPPSMFVAKPVLYMRLLLCVELSPLLFMALGQPDLALMATVAEKAGGTLDHLYTHGGELRARLKTLYPVMLAVLARTSVLMLLRPRPSSYGAPSSLALDSLLHVAAAAALGVATRPPLWAACGVKPASRGRPGRAQVAWQKKA